MYVLLQELVCSSVELVSVYSSDATVILLEF